MSLISATSSGDGLVWIPELDVAICPENYAKVDSYILREAKIFAMLIINMPLSYFQF